MKLERICKMLAARNCFNSGSPVAVIAKQANKSETTIRRWLRVCP